MERTVKILDKEADRVNKTNANYNTRYRNMVQLNEVVVRGQTENMSKKDFAKLQEKATKAKKEAERASADYKLAVMRWTEARHAWEERMIAACDVIQSIETQRVTVTKTILKKLTLFQEEVLMNIISDTLKSILNSIEKIDPTFDIQDFMDRQSTGTEKPPMLKFVDFFTGHKQSFDIKTGIRADSFLGISSSSSDAVNTSKDQLDASSTPVKSSELPMTSSNENMVDKQTHPSLDASPRIGSLSVASTISQEDTEGFPNS
jgi:hypothetical protein